MYFYWRGQTFYRSISKTEFGRGMGLHIRDINWSDDGKRIVVEAIYGSEPAETVLTCKPDGSDVHVLASSKEIIDPKTQQRFYAEWPTISHNGKQVAFAALDVNPREWHVFVVPSRGDARVRVSPAGTRGVKEVGNRSRPFWSPDDSRVAFLDGNHFEGYRLFVVDAGRGKGATKGTVQSFNIPFKKTKWKNIEEATRKIPRGHDYSYLQPYIISWQ